MQVNNPIGRNRKIYSMETKTSFMGSSMNCRKHAATRPFRMPALLGALLCVAGLFASPGKTFSQVTQGVFSETEIEKQGSSEAPDETVMVTVKTNPTDSNLSFAATPYHDTQTF